MKRFSQLVPAVEARVSLLRRRLAGPLERHDRRDGQVDLPGALLRVFRDHGAADGRTDPAVADVASQPRVPGVRQTAFGHGLEEPGGRRDHPRRTLWEFDYRQALGLEDLVGAGPAGRVADDLAHLPATAGGMDGFFDLGDGHRPAGFGLRRCLPGVDDVDVGQPQAFGGRAQRDLLSRRRVGVGVGWQRDLVGYANDDKRCGVAVVGAVEPEADGLAVLDPGLGVVAGLPRYVGQPHGLRADPDVQAFGLEVRLVDFAGDSRHLLFGQEVAEGGVGLSPNRGIQVVEALELVVRLIDPGAVSRVVDLAADQLLGVLVLGVAHRVAARGVGAHPEGRDRQDQR